MKKRILSYDIFRGVLVIGMIIFHVLANLTSISFNQEIFYWVPAGFILFLGIILSQFLGNRGIKKLMIAAKLLAIFLVFNIPNFLSKQFTVIDFIAGSQEIFSFEILFPMAILILLSNLFDIKKLPAKISLLILIASFLILNYLNVFYYNLIFLIYGLIGFFAAEKFSIHKSIDYFKNSKILIALILTILCTYVTYYVGLYDILITIQIFAIYYLTNIVFSNNKTLSIIGKHSLILYVGHIIIIKLISII